MQTHLENAVDVHNGELMTVCCVLTVRVVICWSQSTCHGAVK